MKATQGFSLGIKQKLSLSRNMLLSLELIQMPLLDLKDKIEKEMLENPALEIIENKKGEEQSFDDFKENSSRDDDGIVNLSGLGESRGSLGVSAADSKRQFLEGTISYDVTLYDHLAWQLNCQDLTKEQKEIGIEIISLIDADGFLKTKLEDVFSGNELSVAKCVLEIIQLLDPPGVAMYGVKEALLFQVESMKNAEVNKIAYEILKDHFNLMINRKDNLIAKKMKIDIEEVKHALGFLSPFNPYPGREFSSNKVRYIIPDAFVYKKDNSLVVEMNEDVLPVLTISKNITKIAKDSKGNKKLAEQRKYVTNKVYEANQLIKMVDYRNASLLKLILILVDAQNDFFMKGPKYLKPLTMKTVAEIIDLSESTISRLSSSKYVQTGWGIHEIKYFFSNSIRIDKGIQEKSAEGVRAIIKEIFSQESNKKISDQEIVKMLQNKGIKIARRTVAKYRMILNIPSSHQRI